MRNYMYSYEFYIDKSLWQAQIHKYEGPETYYRHGKSTDLVLSDSGWHCSFCFRYLADFVFKAKAYSHTDRLQGSEKELLDPSRIQKVICEGSDFFGMLPEAYSWKEFVAKVGNLPKDGSAVGLPKYLVENADRFRFLLPGGCVRES
ncbi:hypothetical protein HK097_003020 [Rhizophlyctis rosea]|uniref:Uncharacterized protein n=1 Tax=Rhizophlyctis rosea TaxID=64517 RepID=A0AAD5SIG5_9FUNG|nr:hypothetical protein HK097_003020 [Rhizophlyctis rosea]